MGKTFLILAVVCALLSAAPAAAGVPQDATFEPAVGAFRSSSAARAVPELGYWFNFDEARVWFRKVNPYYSCVVLELSLAVDAGIGAYLGTSPVSNDGARVEYRATDVCTGQAYAPLVGSAPIPPGIFTIDRLESARVTNVVVDVASSDGYIQQFTFNLTWAGNDDPSPWIVHDDVLVPQPGTPAGPSTVHHMERYVTASISGDPVRDLGGSALFAPADSWLAEIGRFHSVTLTKP